MRRTRDVDADLFVRNEGSAARTVALQLYLPRMGASILSRGRGTALSMAGRGARQAAAGYLQPSDEHGPPLRPEGVQILLAQQVD